MPKPVIPPGHVLVRIDDLVRLAAAQSAAATPEPPAPAAAADWEGLSAAVALATARLGGTAASRGDLAPDVSPDAILGALLILVTAALREFLPDAGTRLLRDLGLAAAEEAAR
jgi:hypothetical protein